MTLDDDKADHSNVRAQAPISNGPPSQHVAPAEYAARCGGVGPPMTTTTMGSKGLVSALGWSADSGLHLLQVAAWGRTNSLAHLGRPRVCQDRWAREGRGETRAAARRSGRAEKCA